MILSLGLGLKRSCITFPPFLEARKQVFKKEWLEYLVMTDYVERKRNHMEEN